MKKIMTLCMGLLFSLSLMGTQEAGLEKANIDLRDKPSLQRGAKYFVNYCLGCHTAKYIRYKRIAEDLKLVDEQGAPDATLMKLLMPAHASVNDSMTNGMTPEDSAKWFGVAPPDLSLEARARGADWIYSYLKGFYADEKKPWGVNNVVFKDVAMPHVLVNEQGLYRLVEDVKTSYGETKKVTELRQVTPGKMTSQEYDQMVRDITGFLTYIGEPAKIQRQEWGVWVLLFLAILFMFAWLLKREIWKDVE